MFFGNLLYVGFDPIRMNLREQPGGSAEICLDREPQVYRGSRNLRLRSPNG